VRLDPPVTLQLQELLPDRFTGELEYVGELGDGRGALLLQSDENRPAAVGKLVDGEDAVLPCDGKNRARSGKNSGASALAR
jgi:hypothetical protein